MRFSTVVPAMLAALALVVVSAVSFVPAGFYALLVAVGARLPGTERRGALR